jgi:hypothetical protein
MTPEEFKEALRDLVVEAIDAVGAGDMTHDDIIEALTDESEKVRRAEQSGVGD